MPTFVDLITRRSFSTTNAKSSEKMSAAMRIVEKQSALKIMRLVERTDGALEDMPALVIGGE
jgi:hypothetical protein